MANAPANDQESKLERHALECLDCDELYEDPSLVECPVDPEHAVQGIHISPKGLGFDDDRDHYHHGRRQHEYPAPVG